LTIILGPFILNSNEGVITGGALNASPSSTSKVVAGAGSFNTGYVINTKTINNQSNVYDPDVIDSSIGD